MEEVQDLTFREFRANLSQYLKFIEEGLCVRVNGVVISKMRTRVHSQDEGRVHIEKPGVGELKELVKKKEKEFAVPQIDPAVLERMRSSWNK